MNPNSAHQTWSKWTFTVKPQQAHRILTPEDKASAHANIARFGRKKFGSASQMRLTFKPIVLVVEVRTEGHPVHDPQYQEWMLKEWRAFFAVGFGMETTVALEAHMEAGSKQDGTPSDQLVILPTLSLVD